MTTILITGANRGIGFALAKASLSKGWTVYGSARTQAQADEAAAELGPDFHPLAFDVTDHDAVRRASASFDSPIDIMINNAGIIGPDRQSTLDMDFPGFAKTLEVNTLAPLAVAQAFLPQLRKAEHGRILTVSSQMAWMGYGKSDRIAYRASKAAVNKVMQGLATDLEADKIAVALIDPGWVRTDMGGAAADHEASDVAAGIVGIADRLSMDDTGKFFKWSGEERPF
ncbi:SDR family NAD(P)-dependent oxidoreductase [uncultured Roseibium sp.]|uniref:SDR family NAD(P)-dependent oxidoreductase n=1 Tax=uncultured Roseibium sp. TaxID=1936171 RepID=UPI0032170F92